MAKFTFKQTNLADAWKAYQGASKHRFMIYSYAAILLLFFELLLGVSRNPHVVEYNGVDLWFKTFNSIFQYGTRTFSVIMLGYIGYWLFLDWMGRKSVSERRAEAKMLADLKDFKPKPKGPYRPNWYYFGFQAAEAFAYGTVIYVSLQVIVWLVLLMPLTELPIPKALDASPSLIHHVTNPIQDLALALGAGFYEELIFRYLLFWGLLVLAEKVKQLGRFKAGSTAPIGGLPGLIPKYDLKNSSFQGIILLVTFLYALSHYVYYFGDNFSFYSFLYRFAFGLIMYYISIKRHLSIAMWSHAFHDIWYFLIR